MRTKGKKLRSHCPINFGLEAFGDKWALLILRDIVFRGKHHYGEFIRSEEGMATNILASRLEALVAGGILHKIPSAGDARKDEYHLTEKGLDLIPMLFEMISWSAKYDPLSEAHRIPGLVKLIRENNPKVSEEVKEKVRAGHGIVKDYLVLGEVDR